MFCIKCGNKLAPYADFCTVCGNPAPIKEEMLPSTPLPSPPDTSIPMAKSLTDKSKLLIGLIIVAGFIAIIVAVNVLNNVTDNTGDDFLAAFSSNEDKYVEFVKEGSLKNYPDKTVGEAFDSFMKNAKWESGISEDGIRFVNVRGGIIYADKEVEAVVQFFVDYENDTFEYNACEFNGIPQNNLIFRALLEKVYG